MIYGIIAILIYFIPTLNAYDNKKSNKQSVLVVNIFLGWTIIGWIVALAMSAGKDKVITVVQKESNKDTTTASELEKLSQLKDKGVITQEEFEKQKQKILS